MTFKNDKYFRYLKYGIFVLPFVNSKYENPEMQTVINIIIFIIFIFIAIIMSRPLCKYICPLGLVLAIGNKIPSKKYEVNAAKCTECGLCVKKCKMNIIPYWQINNVECIYCGECQKTCPCKAIYKKPFVISEKWTRERCVTKLLITGLL
jgi:polyferredoxin